jgi:hypothetical protein
MQGFIKFYNTGRTSLQIGENNNLFDWTYFGNHAYAHVLAASALLNAHSSPAIPPPHERVDGEVFYTTNYDEPLLHFWDFSGRLYKSFAQQLGDEVKRKVMPQWQALIFGACYDVGVLGFREEVAINAMECLALLSHGIF